MKQKKYLKKHVKKQRVYFVGLSLLSLLILTALFVNVHNTQTLWQGSNDTEAQLAGCDLEDCSGVKKKIAELQSLLNANQDKKIKINTKINFMAKTENFDQQVQAFATKLNLLADQEGKKAEKIYASYLKAVLKKLALAEAVAMKKINVLDFNKEGIVTIKKYINLSQNIKNAHIFLAELFTVQEDIMKAPEQTNLLSYLHDNKIDQNLLAALLNEHQSRSLSKKARTEQANNKSNIVSQFSSNNDISRSIHLHYQAQAHIFALNQHKYNQAFDRATDRWILEKIAQAEKYILNSDSISTLQRNAKSDYRQSSSTAQRSAGWPNNSPIKETTPDQPNKQGQPGSAVFRGHQFR